LFQEGSFKNGELDGISTQYSEDGRILTKGYYKNDKLVSSTDTGAPFYNNTSLGAPRNPLKIGSKLIPFQSHVIWIRKLKMEMSLDEVQSGFQLILSYQNKA